MADIALLIVEECERRNRISERSGGNKGEEVGMVSRVSLVSQRIDGVSWVNKTEQSFDFPKRVLDPKSELGLAAINGFFSP